MENHPGELFRRRRELITLSMMKLQSMRNNFREIREEIGETRELIYYYCNRQDEHFYNRLIKFYENNRQALKLIEFLKNDMKDLKMKAFGFFEQYGYGNPMEHGRNFPRDLRSFNHVLVERFRMEEHYMNPLLTVISKETKTNEIGIS